MSILAAENSIVALLDRVNKITCNKCGLVVDVEGMEPFSLIQCPHCEHDTLPVPGLLGQFVLFKVMGTGAMGAVYQGFDQTLKRHVAIKVMLTDVAADAQFVEKFLHEAQILAKLNHVNVVQIYTCGQAKGQPYIVMELVDRQRLDDLMTDGRALGETRVLEIGIDVANGLRAAYEVGLVHGDIKPQNILMDRKNTAKVVDFGLAKPSRGAGEISEVWGTPYYIAPEKARKQKEDHRADIYSLGATLFHTLTGEPPFEGETARDVVLARLEHPAPSVHASRPDVSKATADLIARMLETDPFRRYPTYDSLLADMHRALESARQGPRIAPQTRKKSASGNGGRLWGTIAISVFLLAVLGGGLALALRGCDEGGGDPQVKRSTRQVYRMVDGALKSGPVPPLALPFPEQPAGPVALMETGHSRGGDSYIEGGQQQNQNRGQAPLLWVSAPRAGQAAGARKTYLRFDLASLPLYKTEDAQLCLTLAEAGVNSGQGPYTLKLWGINELRGALKWQEGQGGENRNISGAVTWMNAPANEPDEPAMMMRPAELLVEASLGGNAAPGQVLVFENAKSRITNGLVAFLRADKDRLVSLVVTAEPASGLDKGWGFASRQHPDRQAPSLILETRP